MIFSCLLRRLFLLLLFAVVSASPNNANPQCPGGKPPNRDGSCGKQQENKPAASAHGPEQPRPNDSAGAGRSRPKRLRNRSDANTCAINVRVTKQGGLPAAGVSLPV